MRYFLMNKDTEVLFFIPSKSNNFNIEIMGVYNENLVPRPIKYDDDIISWLLNRLRIINRDDLANTLNYHVDKLQVITELTNFISVTDTYWLQTENNQKHWSDISTYQNPLNTDIFRNHFEKAITTHGFGYVPFSYRYWHKQNGNISLYKTGYKESFVYAEYMTSQLGKYLDFDVVNYELITVDNTIVTVSPCICSEQTGMYSIKDIRGSISDIKELFNTDFGEPKHISQRKLIDMVLLDFLTLNIDRNTTNIGVLFNTDTNQLKGIAPLYDFNLSLMAGSNDDDLLCQSLYVGDFKKKYSKEIEQFKYILASDRQYIIHLLDKASHYTFSGKYADTANKVLKHQLSLAYSLL
ncbi:MAG: hypothetical protein IJ861_00405 [Clostridia bacterium]|nr:hypothetical protein [Clostridia bacterium]